MTPLVLDIDVSGRIDVLHDFLAEGLGFSLAFIHAPPGPVRDELLRRLSAWGGTDGVPPLVKVHLTASEWPDRALRELGLDDVERAMVVLTGLEQYAQAEGVSPALAGLNLVRDLLPQWIPGPLVIIASDEAFLSLRESAPDFMTWRAFEWTVLAVCEAAIEFDPAPEPQKPTLPDGSATIDEMAALLHGVLARPHGDLEVARLRLRHGRALVDAYRYAEGEPELTEAARVFMKEGRTANEADALSLLGLSALRQSDHEKARARFEQALSRYQQMGDVLGEANCIDAFGEIAILRSDLEAAQAHYEQALTLHKRTGNEQGEAHCIWSLGDIALRRLDYETARVRYEQALPLYQKVGNVKGEANCLYSMGTFARNRLDYETARARYEQALLLYQKTGAAHGEGNCILSLGQIALRENDIDTARVLFERALRLYERVGSVQSIARAHHRLAKVARTPEQRHRHIEAARQAWKRIGRDDLITKFLDAAP